MISSIVIILIGIFALWYHYKIDDGSDYDDSYSKLNSKGSFIGGILGILLGILSVISELREIYGF